MLGKKYGRLTVIGFAKNDKYQNAQWLCRCDCGLKRLFREQLFDEVTFKVVGV